ncbi:unnamed protein product [Parajaminaea phylloscopi]
MSTTHSIFAAADDVAVWDGHAATAEDKAYLSSIPVGCLGVPEYKEMTIALNLVTRNTVKLENKPQDYLQFLVWLEHMNSILGLWAKGRAKGIINDTIEGSTEAYRRYFGTPASEDAPGEPLEEVYAKQFRDKDSSDLAIVLQNSVSPDVLGVFINTKYNTSIARSLWLGILNKFVPKGSGAKQRAAALLSEYSPGGKGTEAIVSDIRKIYSIWRLTFGRDPEEEDMVQTLLKHLPPHMTWFKYNIRSSLDVSSPTFEDLADMAIRFESDLVADDLRRNAQPIHHNFMPTQTTQPLAIGYQTGNGRQFPPHMQQQQGSFPRGGYPQQSSSPQSSNGPRTPSPNDRRPRDMSQMICYKCRNKGHFAEKCPMPDDEIANYMMPNFPPNFGMNNNDSMRRFAY